MIWLPMAWSMEIELLLPLLLAFTPVQAVAMLLPCDGSTCPPQGE
jgi:hypothetical protein